MDDDFNTGGGIGTLFDLVRAINKYADNEKLEGPAGRTPGDCPDFRVNENGTVPSRTPDKLDAFRRAVTVLRELTGTLGLFRKPQEQKAPGGDDLTGKLMALLIDLRAEARKRKDFATADRIRNTLGQIGVALEDRPAGRNGAASRSHLPSGIGRSRLPSGIQAERDRNAEGISMSSGIGTSKSGSASRTYYWLTAFSACATYGKQGRAGPRPAASTSPAPARPPSRSR